jgi:hypothetical protein
MAAEDLERLGDAVGPRHDAVDEIRAVERADENLWVAEVQLPGDVVADPRGGGGGEGMDAGRWEAVAEQGELPVFGAEVVAPLADAVGLVDREPLHAHLGQEVEQAGVHQPLRGGEQEPQFARRQRSRTTADRSSCDMPGVDRRRRVADRLEGIDLVLHQGDERRDHDVGRLAHERRQLVAEALAAARGHHDQRVAAGERRAWIASACSGRSRSKPHQRASTSAIRASSIGSGRSAVASAGPGTDAQDSRRMGAEVSAVGYFSAPVARGAPAPIAEITASWGSPTRGR